MPTTKGLIFDLDGTLTLTQQFHYQAYRKVFKKYNIKYTSKDDYAYAGKGSSCIFPEIFSKHGKKISKKDVEKYATEKKLVYDEIINKNTIQPVDGIKKFLKHMKKNGVAMAVASGNKAESIQKILKKTGLLKYFKIIITNKDVQKSKPAPDIFLKAAHDLNLKPKNCIVFEDAINGIVAAKKAKIPCIGLATGFSKKTLLKAGALKAIKSYNELSLEDFLPKIAKKHTNP